MKRITNWTIYLLLTLLVNACSYIQEEKKWLYDLTYNQIKERAQLSDREFCIIIYNEDYDLNLYKAKIISPEIRNKVLWNFVNTDFHQHSWYKYLLGSEKVPFTLLFDRTGHLKNIVYGISRYSHESIKSTILFPQRNIKYKNFGFNENSIININYYSIDSYIDEIINICHDSTYTNVQRHDKLNHSISKFEYPYNLFLKLCLDTLELQKDSIAILANKMFRKFANAHYSAIYKPLFKEISDRTTTGKTPLFISIPQDGKHYPIESLINITAKVTNITADTIKITKIEPSCNCITLTDTQTNAIPPFSTLEYKFLMEADMSGELFREIYFHTDSCVPLIIAEFKIIVN